MIPFNLKGRFELELPHQTEEEIIYRIVQALEVERAKNIRCTGNRIRFRGGQFRTVGFRNRLSSITTGTIAIERKNEHRIRVQYFLTVWELLLISTGVVAGLFGVTIWLPYPSNPPTVMLILGGVWLWLCGGSFVRVRFFFPWFLKDSITFD